MMKHGMFGAHGLMAPLGRLLRHFHVAPTRDRLASPPTAVTRQSPVTLRVAVRPARAMAARSPAAMLQPRCNARFALRVVRVVESGQPTALTGRMRMSGRMADVCAELDRMVERETAVQSRA